MSEDHVKLIPLSKKKSTKFSWTNWGWTCLFRFMGFENS